MSSIEPQSTGSSRDTAGDPTARWSVPSWAISAVFHIVLFLSVALLMSAGEPQGAAAVRTADVGIVLKQQNDQQETTYDSPELQQARAEARTLQSAAEEQADVSAEDVFSESPPDSDLASVLPQQMNVIGMMTAPGSGNGNAQDATAGGTRPGGGVGDRLGGKGRTSVFGLPGEGYSFCYVFDRSASMGGSGRSPLATAKSQMIASLNSLEKNHQFQIIFYNQTPMRFNPLGNPNDLFFATDRNRKLAMNFIQSITADGNTDHEPALLLAINMQPDVIFFLTDADDPQLTPSQMRKIRSRAQGIVINTIEFGVGNQQNPDNFLVRLARENNGQHKYVDITKFGTAVGADRYDASGNPSGTNPGSGSAPFGSGQIPSATPATPATPPPSGPPAPLDFDLNLDF